MSNDGAGYVAIGSAIDEKDGKRKLVFLRHASKPSTGQGDGRRIIIVVDFKFDSDDAHDKYIVSVKEGKLKPCFSFRKANIQDEPLPASNHASLVSAVEARLSKARVYISKSLICRNDWCTRPATCLDVSGDGRKVFDSIQSGEDNDALQPFLTCGGEECLAPGSITNLCLGCYTSEKLGGTQFCGECGKGECTGFLEMGKRTFACIDRTIENIANGVGVTLDETNISSQRYNICRECLRESLKKCNHPGCEKYSQAKGFCSTHGGKKKK